MTWNIFQGCAQIWIDQWLNNSWEIDLKFTSDRLWLHLMANGLWSILRSILISFTTFHILSMVDVWKNVFVSFLRQTFTKGDIKYIFKSNVWKPTLCLDRLHYISTLSLLLVARKYWGWMCSSQNVDL